MDSVEIRKFKIQTFLAIIILALGILVLTYGIVFEDEPTAVALLLIVAGTIWLFITRLVLKSKS